MSRGQLHTAQVLNSHCSPWREVWAGLADWRFDGSESCSSARVVKVPAHSTRADVSSGRVS
eukprot:4770330-Pyramimonas_sp.AAC.1